MDNQKQDNQQDNPKEELNERAEKVIRNHIAWSMGAGLIPIPIADFFAVSAVQLDMIRQLCRLYNIPFKETEGKAIITSLVGSGLSRLGAQAAVKFIPGIGSAVGGVAMSLLSGASTYALGQVFKTHFETGGTILDFDTDRFKKYYEDQFNKGQDVARDVQKEHKEKKAKTEAGVENQKEKVRKQQEVKVETNTPKEEVVIIDEEKANTTNSEKNTKSISRDDILKKLRELNELKEMGVIDETEFNQMKKSLLENF